jgi:hypothetical protein
MASAVSCGLLAACRSSAVRGLFEELEATVETTREQPTASVGSESAPARLAALEHLLDAVTTVAGCRGERAREDARARVEGQSQETGLASGAG